MRDIFEEKKIIKSHHIFHCSIFKNHFKNGAYIEIVRGSWVVIDRRVVQPGDFSSFNVNGKTFVLWNYLSRCS